MKQLRKHKQENINTKQKPKHTKTHNKNQKHAKQKTRAENA